MTLYVFEDLPEAEAIQAALEAVTSDDGYDSGDHSELTVVSRDGAVSIIAQHDRVRYRHPWAKEREALR